LYIAGQFASNQLIIITAEYYYEDAEETQTSSQECPKKKFTQN
jgi:hypothetical protein